MRQTFVESFIFKGVAIVRNLLESWIGKEIDVLCEGTTVTGKVLRVEGLNVYDLMRYEHLILTDGALKLLEERLAA